MDSIQKMLHGMGEVLAKVLTGKEIKHDAPIILEDLEVDDIYSLAEFFIKQNRFQDAEDFMFKNIETNYSEELYISGKALVEKVIAKGDKHLRDNGYSLNEATSWQADWEGLKADS